MTYQRTCLQLVVMVGLCCLGAMEAGAQWCTQDLTDSANAYMERASAFYGQNKLNDALKAFENAYLSYHNCSDRGEAQALNGKGFVYFQLRQLENALAAFENARTLYHHGGYLQDEITTLNQIGRVNTLLGHYRKALENFNEALSLLLENGAEMSEDEKHTKVRILNNRGAVHLNLVSSEIDWGFKDIWYEKALRDFSDAEALAQNIGDSKGMAAAFMNIGTYHLVRREYPEAREAYEDHALPIKQQLHDTSGEGMVYLSLGDVYLRHGDSLYANENYTLSQQEYAKALPEFRSALEQYVEPLVSDLSGIPTACEDRAETYYRTNDLAGKATACAKIGETLYKLEQFDEALKRLEPAAEIYHESGNFPKELEVSEFIAESYQYIDVLETLVAALPHYQENSIVRPVLLDQIRELYNESSIDVDHATRLTDLADINYEQGKYSDVITILAPVLSANIDDAGIVGKALLLTGKANLRQGNDTLAISYLEQAQTKDNALEGECLLHLGEAYLHLGNYRNAFDKLMPALDKIATTDCAKEGTIRMYIGEVYTGIRQAQTDLDILNETVTACACCPTPQTNDDPGLKILKEALSILQETTDKSRVYEDIGNVYYDILMQKAEALTNYENALGFYRETGNSDGELRMLNTILNLQTVLTMRMESAASLVELGKAYFDSSSSRLRRRTYGYWIDALTMYAGSEHENLVEQAAHDLNTRTPLNPEDAKNILILTLMIDNTDPDEYERNNEKKKAEAVMFLAYWFYNKSYYTSALVYLDVAFSLYETLRDDAGMGEVFLQQGDIYTRQGNAAQGNEALEKYEDALTAYSHAQQAFYEISDRTAQGKAFMKMYEVYEILGQTEQMEALYENHGMDMLSEVENIMAQILELMQQGDVYVKQGKYEDALDVYRRALVLIHESGLFMFEGMIYEKIAGVYQPPTPPDPASIRRSASSPTSTPIPTQTGSTPIPTLTPTSIPTLTELTPTSTPVPISTSTSTPTPASTPIPGSTPTLSLTPEDITPTPTDIPPTATPTTRPGNPGSPPPQSTATPTSPPSTPVPPLPTRTPSSPTPTPVETSPAPVPTPVSLSITPTPSFSSIPTDITPIVTPEIFAPAPITTSESFMPITLKDHMNALQKAAESYAQSGQFAKAVKNYEHFRKYQQRVNDIEGEIDTILRIVDILNISGDRGNQDEKVLTLLEKADILHIKLEGQQPEKSQASINTIKVEIYRRKITTYRRRGEYEKALELNEKIIALNGHRTRLDALQIKLSIYQEMGEPRLAQAEVMQEIVDILLFAGQDERALTYLDEMVGIFKETGAHAQAAETQNSVGLIYLRQGDFYKADRAFLAAEEILEKHGHETFQAITDHNRGVLRYMLGQYKEAEDFLQKALVANDTIGVRHLIETIGLISKSAGSYIFPGQRRETKEFFEDASTVRRNLNDDLMLRGFILNHLALVYYKQMQEVWEEYDKTEQLYITAKEHFLQAKMIIYGTDEGASEGTILNNMGLLDYSMGRIEGRYGSDGKAQEYYEKALQAYQSVLAQPLHSMAGKSATMHNIGQVYAGLGQYEEALDYLKRALENEQEIDKARTFAEIGYVYERMNDLEHALIYYLKSIEIQEKIRWESKIEEFKISLAEQTVDVYQQTVLLLMSMNRPEEAFNMTERARARTFLDLLGNEPLHIRNDIEPDLLKQEQALKTKLSLLSQYLRKEFEKPLRVDNRQEIEALKYRITQKLEDHKKLLMRIKIESPEYASLISIEPLELPSIQEMLDKNTTLISYFVTTEKTIAFIITHDAFEAVPLSPKKPELQQLIKNIHQKTTPVEPVLQDLQQLHSWLITPIRTHIKPDNVVGIIPHSVLHYLPFAALSDGRMSSINSVLSPYFGDNHVLFSLPSANVLQFIRGKYQKSKMEQVLALGYAAGKAENLAYLKYAEKEAESAAGMYNAKAHTGNAASETLLKSQGSLASLIHIASHVSLSKDYPFRSHFVLAPDDHNDGRFNIREAYNLLLQKAELVILSACETSLGRKSRGDEIIAFNRAFIYAGAPSVIASLWNVDDKATYEFMLAFYKHFKQDKSIAEALQQARIETREKYPHPRYWAAFVLTGNPGNEQTDFVANAEKQEKLLQKTPQALQ